MILNFAKIINAVWLFFVGAKAFIVKYVEPAIQIVELVKAFITGNSVESELVRSILTKIFPGLNIDQINANMDSFTAQIAQAIRNIAPGQSFDAAGVADADVIKGFIDYIIQNPNQLADALYHALAVELTRLLSNNTTNAKFHLDTVVQVAYANVKTNPVKVNPVAGTPVIPFAPASAATVATDTRSPQQKAADTRAANKAAKLN